MDYLGSYESRGLRRERLFKWGLVALAAAVALGTVYYVIFRNWREELLARRFLKTVQQGDYQTAYEIWGCSVSEPCRYYPYEEFLEDWGPEAPYGEMREFSLGRSYTQPNGVIVRYSINGSEGNPLWVELDPPKVNFAPR